MALIRDKLHLSIEKQPDLCGTKAQFPLTICQYWNAALVPAEGITSELDQHCGSLSCSNAHEVGTNGGALESI